MNEEQKKSEDYQDWLKGIEDLSASKMEVAKRGGCPKCDGTGYVNHIDRTVSHAIGKYDERECDCWTSEDAHCPACGSDRLKWTEDESDAICQTCGWVSNPSECTEKD